MCISFEPCHDPTWFRFITNVSNTQWCYNLELQVSLGYKSEIADNIVLINIKQKVVCCWVCLHGRWVKNPAKRVEKCTAAAS